MKDLNNLNKNNKLLQKILDADIKDVDATISEYEKFAYNLAWEKLYEDKWIVEVESLYDVLEYFIDEKDNFKVKYISEIINKYYPNFFTEKMNEFMKEEKYELCEKIKKFIQ
jgi:hypothetical protein